MFSWPMLSLFVACFGIVEGSVIYTAQCRSRCKRLHSDDRQTQSSYSQCLTPCLEDLSTLAQFTCLNYSQTKYPNGNSAPCHHSCKFIKGLYRDGFKPGRCLSVKKSYEYCLKDSDCEELSRCCYDHCEEISVQGEEVQMVVSDVTNSSLVAHWQQSNISNAVYIVQIRELHSSTIYYADNEWGKWWQLIQGSGLLAIRLSKLHPGIRLQLRIAVVNETGLKSIGPPTPVIQTIFNPRPPSGAQRFSVQRKAYKNSEVNVTVVWLHPKVLDIPVHSYRLFWKEIPQITTDFSVIVKQRTRVEGSQLNYTITGLKKDTTYSVEVQAVCLWKRKRFKGPKVSLKISTGHLKDAKEIVYFNNVSKDLARKQANYSSFQDEKITVEAFVDGQKESSEKPSQRSEQEKGRNSAARKRLNILPTLLLLSLSVLFV